MPNVNIKSNEGEKGNKRIQGKPDEKNPGKKRLRSIFTEDGSRTTEGQRRTIEATLILEATRGKSESDMGLAREAQSQREKFVIDYAKQEGILFSITSLGSLILKRLGNVWAIMQ